MLLFKGQRFGNLPSEFRVVAAEVPISRCLLHNSALEIKIPDDATRSQIKIVFDNLREVGVRFPLRDGPVRIHVHGEGKRDSNRVAELHEAPLAEPRGDEALGHPPGSVRGGPVHFGRVLAAEGPAAVGAPAPVGVHDDLSPREPRVPVRAPNHKPPAWVHVVHRLVVQVLLRDHELDHVLHEAFSDDVHGHLFAVLRRDHHRVHSLGDRHALHVLVLDRDLGLPVGPHPVEELRLAHLRESKAEACCELVTQRHHGLRLVSGEAKHDALVARSDVLLFRRVNTLCDVGALLFNCHNYVDCLVVKPLCWIIITDLLERLANNHLVIHCCRCRDLTKDHNHSSFGAALASHTTGRVILHAGIKNGIGDLITDFVWVAFIHRLASEEKCGPIGLCSCHSSL
mmetsp:Transcript_66092/g.133146  ORF Transcript_66092/g.133146 Transcript_66092/m.133146 type:complete len:399 (-) Transcript_66092:21-1217(-)